MKTPVFETLQLDGKSLSVEQVLQVAIHHRRVELNPTVIPQIEAARALVEDVIQSKQVTYGVNTGFGYLKNQSISDADLETLQRNLILSHACGVGEAFSSEIVRAIMLLRANTLVQGHSGVRLELVEHLIACLNAKVHPLIPSQGSVGSSGDLAPLAHLALTLIGEGQAEYQGQKMPSAQALQAAGLSPIVLQAKEGLALINGTQPMSAVACLVAQGLKELLDSADAIAAMSIQAGMGSCQPFRADLHAVRPHPGQKTSASLLWAWMQASELVLSHHDCDQVQDAYSYRCCPQVHGASRDAYEHIQAVVSREINSVTDNPIILPETQEIISGGHFHGQPIALVMDFAKIAIAELANISERRIERLVNPQLSQGLPAFLTPQGGLNSGLMIAQYAAASLVSENKVLAHPASVDSIPTSANQEDHVSMGTIAARQAWQILKNARQVLAIELLCACQALDLRKPLKPSPTAQIILERVRAEIPTLNADRFLGPELEMANLWLSNGSFWQIIDALKPKAKSV